jgi:hypothetical protein
MQTNKPTRPQPAGSGQSPWLWIVLGTGALLVLWLALWREPQPEPPAELEDTPVVAPADSNTGSALKARLFSARRAGTSAGPTEIAAEQVVSNKLAQFARSRRSVAEAMARKAGVEVSPEIERFFAAVEAGNWDDAKALFHSLRRKDDPESRSPEVLALWPAIHETFGVAETVHEWPAQKLLDYGQDVLGALRPGMIYIGGTEPGRFIPTLLNETSGGEPHVVLTQNALADGSYLKYTEFLYGDRLQSLNGEDSQQAFKGYLDDAKRRLEHDQQFPEEPKQVRPGEDIRVVENRVQVSGQVAVMSINERLLQTLLEKNPGVPFALEESVSMKSTYAGAAPLGPILELRAMTEQNPVSATQAGQALDYWRTQAQQLAGEDPASDVRKTYAHMAMAQANFFADQHLNPEAERAYRLASEMAPGYLEPVGGLFRLLVEGGRANEGEQLLNTFAARHPEQQTAVQNLREGARRR